jgi:endonuclease/exonuclease/phosphatase family metal-dependent hydrolase
MNTSRSVAIISHNVFWFQGVPFGTDRPGEPVDPITRALADRYRSMAPDVLCLQEVQSRSAAERMGAHLNMDVEYCRGVQHAQYGGAILHRGGRLVVDASASAISPQRMWQIIDFSPDDSPPVRICNLHMPSGRQLGPEASAARRLEEITDMLANHAASITEHAGIGDAGGRLVIAGDFNERPDGALGALLSERGFVDAALVAGHSHLPTSLGGSRGDQIWVGRDLADGIDGYAVAGVAEMVAPVESGKEYTSDHMPLAVTLG